MDETSAMDETALSSAVGDSIKSFIAGGFGGICAVLTGHPFDLTKVLLQTKQYDTTWHAVVGTFQKHGLLGFYKGVSSPLLGVTPMFAVSFWGYDTGQRIVRSLRKKPENRPLSISEISAAGFLSAIPTTLIAGPFERVKVVMQVSKQKVSFVSTVKQIYKEGGVRSIFKGSGATLARDGPGSAVYFATYEYLKQKLSHKGANGKDQPLSIGAIMTAGGFAGVAMWVTIYPVDTIKSVQQSSVGKITIAQTARQIYSKAGIKGFFPGIGPALLRSFPANAATFLGVEVARKALDKWV